MKHVGLIISIASFLFFGRIMLGFLGETRAVKKLRYFLMEVFYTLAWWVQP